MGFIHMDISAWIYPYEYIHMDISLWIYPYGYIHMDISIPYMGSQGSLGWDPLGGIPWVGYLGGTDGTLGPMGPGPQGPWASRTSTISIWISISIPGPARPGPVR